MGWGSADILQMMMMMMMMTMDDDSWHREDGKNQGMAGGEVLPGGGSMASMAGGALGYSRME